MNRRWILLNVALIALAGLLGWMLRQHWIQARAHEREIFDRAAHARTVLPLPPIAPPGSVAATQYLDVATRMLFASDRNPNVVIVAPPPPPPAPPMPALPAYFGQMHFIEPTVVLSTPSNPQKSYRVGEKIGPFEIVSFDREKIAFKWENKTVEKKLSELAVKDAPPEVAEQDPRKFPPQSQLLPGRGPTPSQSLGGASSDLGNKPDGTLGVDMVDGKRGCVSEDKSPAGTIVNGMKKVMPRTLMGFGCYWEPVAK